MPYWSTLIVDPSTLFCEGVRTCLCAGGFEVLGIASTQQAALEVIKIVHPKLCLIGPFAGESFSFSTCRALVKYSPRLKVIFLTPHYEEPLFQVDAVHAGATAWLPHDVSHVELLIGLVLLISGRQFLPYEAALVQANPDNLTAREISILQILANGKTDS